MGRLTPDEATATEPPALLMMAAGVARRYGGGCKPLAPVGLHGEAIIDLTAGDARRAGFGAVVLVVNPVTGPAIDYHVRRCWPPSMAVASTVQSVPLGTVHAVLRARPLIGERPFAVVNADDIYGTDAMELLTAHLATAGDHALVSYPLADTVVTDDPVTRGVCEVDGQGWLRAVVERRHVARHRDGRFTADDGVEPKELAPDAPVSMNLWGFTPAIWPVLAEALRRVHPELGADGSVPDGVSPADTEVLLPEVVGAMAGAPGADRTPGARVRVIPATGRVVGVTHAEDLPMARTELAEMVGAGLRPEAPWGDVP